MWRLVAALAFVPAVASADIMGPMLTSLRPLVQVTVAGAYPVGPDYVGQTCNSAEFDCSSPPAYLLRADDFEDGILAQFCGNLGGAFEGTCVADAAAAGFSGYTDYTNANVNDLVKYSIFGDWDDPRDGQTTTSNGTTINRNTECSDAGEDTDGVGLRSPCGVNFRPLPPLEAVGPGQTPSNNPGSTCYDPLWTGNSVADGHVRGTGPGSASFPFGSDETEIRLRFYFMLQADPLSAGHTTETCFLGSNNKWISLVSSGGGGDSLFIKLAPTSSGVSAPSNSSFTINVAHNFINQNDVFHSGPGSAVVDIDKFYRLELYVKSSSGGGAVDGVLRMWLDECDASQVCPTTSTLYLEDPTYSTEKSTGQRAFAEFDLQNWTNGGGYLTTRVDQLIVVDDALFQVYAGPQMQPDAQGNIGEMTVN